jgi:UDP-4-amino-4,6-dideoxy-N-acetyl-beta-L-altrosamine transaminase
MNHFLNYGKHWLDDDDINTVINVLKSDFITQGPEVGRFEKALANYVGAAYAVAVANGTAALHLAVKALNLGKGKEGITTPITFAASSNCFLYNGLKPGFVDIYENTYCMDPAELEKRITPETKVIIPVHFAGQPAEMGTIDDIAVRNDIYVIEDAAHAIGSKFADGEMVGSCCCSDMTIFSFHPVKTIATGEGGAITTNDKDLYERLVLLRNHGITKEASKLKIQDPELTGPWYYEMQDLGFNYRMTDIQAALGTSQLKKIEGFVKRRREIVKTYNEAFKDVSWLTTPYEWEGASSAFHLYVIKIDFQQIGKTRSQVMMELKEKGIGTQVHYIPVHLQPYYREHFGFKEGDFPKAEHYYQQCLSIPLFPKMTDKDVQRVIDAIMRL